MFGDAKVAYVNEPPDPEHLYCENCGRPIEYRIHYQFFDRTEDGLTDFTKCTVSYWHRCIECTERFMDEHDIRRPNPRSGKIYGAPLKY